MTLKNDIELANTRAKLARVETRYRALQEETGGDEELREVTMESLKRFINQLSEEITRYETCRSGQGHGGTRGEGLRNDRELANTREKLQVLEKQYESLRVGTSEDQDVHRVSMRSLKRTINQLKEEIARYEARQPARR